MDNSRENPRGVRMKIETKHNIDDEVEVKQGGVYRIDYIQIQPEILYHMTLISLGSHAGTVLLPEEDIV